MPHTCLKSLQREINELLDMRLLDADDVKKFARDLRKDADELDRIAREEMR